eukprot:199415-Pelagomonas_calceolata.AAC.2
MGTTGCIAQTLWTQTAAGVMKSTGFWVVPVLGGSVLAMKWTEFKALFESKHYKAIRTLFCSQHSPYQIQLK